MTKNRSCTGKIRHETRAAADNHLRFLRRIDRLLRTWLRAAGADPALSAAYRERAQLLALLASIYPSQIQPDPAEPDWQVLYLRLPTGQTTRHIAPGDVELFTHPGGRAAFVGAPARWTRSCRPSRSPLASLRLRRDAVVSQRLSLRPRPEIGRVLVAPAAERVVPRRSPPPADWPPHTPTASGLRRRPTCRSHSGAARRGRRGVRRPHHPPGPRRLQCAGFVRSRLAAPRAVWYFGHESPSSASLPEGRRPGARRFRRLLSPTALLGGGGAGGVVCGLR